MDLAVSETGPLPELHQLFVGQLWVTTSFSNAAEYPFNLLPPLALLAFKQLVRRIFGGHDGALFLGTVKSGSRQPQQTEHELGATTSVLP
jgi:hypothetical protein